MVREIHNRRYVAVLSVLLAAFVLRVLAQLMQTLSNVPWLPPFEAWAAGGLPYPVLVAVQVIVVAAAVEVIRKLARGDVRPQRNWAIWLLGLGAVYFVAMAFRLAAGLTFLAGSAWFAASLPAVFHLVLAGIVLTVGHYHWARA
jgi:hypothetical protein